MADEVSGTVVGLAFDYPGGFEVERHRHRRDQLIFATRGVITVTTARGSWVLPPGRALWMPAGIEHAIRTRSEVRLRTIYVDPWVEPRGPREVRVLAVPRLLAELILRAVEVGPELLPEEDGGERPALVALLLEEFQRARQAPLHVLQLPRGSDSRLARLMDGLEEEPSNSATLAEWGRRVGASERTLDRLFRAEAGMTFGAWRRQLRLQKALELLALGQSVSQVAPAVGYESLSAFITMVRRALGQSPTAYLSR